MTATNYAMVVTALIAALSNSASAQVVSQKMPALSANQRAEIDRIHQRIDRHIEALRHKVVVKRIQLERALAAPSLDAAHVRRRQAEMHAVARDLRMRRVDARLMVAKLIETPLAQDPRETLDTPLERGHLATLKKLHSIMKEEVAPIMARLNATQKQLAVLWSTTPLNEMKIREKENEAQTLISDIQDHITEVRISTIAILSLNERARLKEYEAEHGPLPEMECNDCCDDDDCWDDGWAAGGGGFSGCDMAACTELYEQACEACREIPPSPLSAGCWAAAMAAYAACLAVCN